MPLAPAVMVKSEAVPERLTACAAPTESVSVMLPLVDPEVEAVKITPIVQLDGADDPAGANDCPDVQVPPLWENAFEKTI